VPEVDYLDGDSRLFPTIPEEHDGIPGFQERALDEALVTLERGVGVRDPLSYRLSVIKIPGDTIVILLPLHNRAKVRAAYSVRGC